MLAVARRIPKIDQEMRAGAWPRELLTQLLGKTLGVFGTGRITARGARAVQKDEICRAADVITLHLRLGPETRGFLGRREFALMKRTALLVNTARGAPI